MARILLIDDDNDFTRFLQNALGRTGHHVDCLESPFRAPEQLSQANYDVVLLDNRMPGMSGIEFLAVLEEHQISVPVILMTGGPTSDIAIQATKLGAYAYVVKPLEFDDLLQELLPLIDEASKIARLTREHVRLPGEAAVGEGPELLGNSRPMQEVYKLVGKVARSNVPVLIRGESGTGKDLVARAIHGNSPRRPRPFVAMNVTSLNENLLDDELFGHEPRSFSGAGDTLRKGRFEHAHGGTLFLDEIGDMPPMLQAKLLRVLENNEVVRIGGNEPLKVDVRVVSATHRDLTEATQTGKFRQDLLFRINGVTIRLPPLRERGHDDLRLIVEHLIVREANDDGRSVPTLTDAAWQKLCEHSWPGNIRELRNVVRRAVLICRGTQIGTEDLELGDSAAADAPSPPENHGDTNSDLARAVQAALTTGQPNLHQSLHDALDMELLRRTLAECNGNQVQTARRLGLSRNGLRARLRALGLE
jgi:DNA-binding NtrC family response regulator